MATTKYTIGPKNKWVEGEFLWVRKLPDPDGHIYTARVHSVEGPLVAEVQLCSLNPTILKKKDFEIMAVMGTSSTDIQKVHRDSLPMFSDPPK